MFPPKQGLAHTDPELFRAIQSKNRRQEDDMPATPEKVWRAIRAVK